MSQQLSVPLSVKNISDVFLLFTIPVGGGIPAGVVLGNQRGLSWIVMTGLYFVSDLCLAVVFEPMLYFLSWLADRNHFLDRFRQAFRRSTAKASAIYGGKPGPLALVGISFGVDPMTGRAAALANGHGFVGGWAVAIAGDMLFFLLIMGSTLWLNNLLGDGTLAAIIIMVAMLVAGPVVRYLRRLL